MEREQIPPKGNKRVPHNPSPWQPHDEPAEGSRAIEESNRQASRSMPVKYSKLAIDISSGAEPSDSGPEYFGRQ